MAITRKGFLGSIPALLSARFLQGAGESAPAVDPRTAAAQPVWPAGYSDARNLFVGFRAVFEAPQDRAALRLTACSAYRAFLNGEFLGYGPARGPHGHFRLDEWDLTDKLRPGENIVAIEVAAYNISNYYLPKQPPFLLAEIVSNGKAIAATGDPARGFQATLLSQRLQRVQRYSKQRTFTEAYRLTPDSDAWRSSAAAHLEPVRCEIASAVRLLPRRVPYPEFSRRRQRAFVASGRLEAAPASAGSKPLPGVAPDVEGFRASELEIAVTREFERFKSTVEPAPAAGSEAAVSLDGKSFGIFDFGTNLTGFIGAEVTCKTPTRLYLLFDEVLSDGDVDHRRLNCVNVVAYELAPGRHRIETFEPYTLRYLKAAVLDGACEIREAYIREYVNPDTEKAQFAASDERLNRLFSAGVETFRQNAVDVFMDCPSRERAGWLCDSYFTARVAADLSGNTLVEKNFFENFLLPQHYPEIPDGMLPMCYPADHVNGTYIPNWSLWFVVELQEYLARSGDRAMVEALRPKIFRLFEFFKQFRNEDGLLEKLKSWVFIEWSKANSFVQDVNYPSNMLYAAALDAAGRMYGHEPFRAEAAKVRETIRRQSFDGEFFVDNAVREGGKLNPTRNRTEACQYFAFYFGTASPGTHARLWEVLRDKFGPNRARSKAFPEIYPANSFVGNVLRLELLSRYGLAQQFLDESISYLLYMAERTGTLWENVDAHASCNHGFASHIVHALYRDVLGIYEVDHAGRTVKLRIPKVNLNWCEGRMPVPGGKVSLRWREQGGRIAYEASVPAGYALAIENASGKEIIDGGTSA